MLLQNPFHLTKNHCQCTYVCSVEMEAGIGICLVFLDAKHLIFDTASHQLLMEKLQLCKPKPSWLCSYLVNRQQEVMVGIRDHSSDLRCATGSALGP